MRRLFQLLMVLAVVLAYASAPAFCHSHDKHLHEDSAAIHAKKGVTEEIVIHASPKIVWQSMQEQRKKDPDSTYLKTVKHSETAKELEQRFIFPSPFGDAECLLELVEKQGERVDYKLKESEDLKAMEGSWVLTPVEEGKATKLSLTSYVEPGIYVPRIIVNSLIKGRVQRNLNMVKKIAESAPLSVAERGSGVQ